MSWTTERPKESGYYWWRDYIRPNGLVSRISVADDKVAIWTGDTWMFPKEGDREYFSERIKEPEA